MGALLISVDELRPLIGTAQAPRILDVRRPQAYAESDRVLPAAVWRDHTQARAWGADLPVGQPVVVYCVHGHNVSQFAAAALREIGCAARALAGGIEAWRQAGGTTVLKRHQRPQGAEVPSRWVTRIRPKIDRIACPWLIRRFVDPEARFHFVEPDQVAAVAEELKGVAFDIAGAELSHEGELCTFDILLRHFELEDPDLLALAPIVRGADTARLDLAPEAAGLLAVSLGNSVLAGGDDHAALARGFAVYDALLAWRRHASHERHNWPVAAA